MILSESQRIEMEKAALPLIEWINKLPHSMVKILVDCSSVELMERVSRIVNEDYLLD